MKHDLAHEDGWREDANALIRAANQTSAMGRQVLVVIGAGCSVAAGMPQMRGVYHDLRSRLMAITPAVRDKRQVKDLLAWLGSLEDGTAPRSIAAKTLGTLQTADRLSDMDVAEALSDIWSKFSEAFVGGRVGQVPATAVTTNTSGIRSEPVEGISPTLFPDQEEFQPIFARPPTDLHNAVADWVISRRAFVVSVNFDGLTRKAIRLRSQVQNPEAGCVVLNSPPQLRNYFLGEQYRQDAPLFCVVKVWGDVFHAVCRNAECAEADKEVPIYLLEERDKVKFAGADIRHALACPECAAPRQLQVFFPGYQKKEAQTTELMQALWAYVSARIGVILIVGLSGIWDNALVEFLTDISRDLQREGVQTPLFCVDPDPTAYLPAALRHRGINVVHIRTTADSIAEFCPPGSTDVRPVTYPKGSRVGETDSLWAGLIDRDMLESRTPYGYEQIHSLNYLEGFEKLRQLGLKTRLTKLGKAEIDHNRLKHSLGASNLAWYWITTLLDEDKGDYSSTLRTIVPSPIIESLAILAAVHHDLGHLPFTHLAEEVFHELNWTTSPWSSHFRHDEQVFVTAKSSLVEKARATIMAAASGLAIVPPTALVEWTQRAVEGRSGIPLLDAILNSPLDVDKIDYVFRDCYTLDRTIHLPSGNKERLKWFTDFVTDSQQILPSGLIALSGTAGDHARDFLEERRWLYKYLYFRPAYRVVERIGRSVLTLWLTHVVPERLAATLRSAPKWGDAQLLADVRALKGREAQALLWSYLDNLKGSEGEPEMILKIAEEVASEGFGKLPRASGAKDWIMSCYRLLETTLKHEAGIDYEELMQKLKGVATWSERMYVPYPSYRNVGEIIRILEIGSPFGAVFDIAVMPRMLAYPNRRRFESGGNTVMGEMFAVPHCDPDRWGRRTGRWIPLSQSAYAEQDENRWLQVIVISPREKDDSNIRYAEDRFRHSCKERGVCVRDEDPESIGVTRLTRDIEP